MNTPTLRAAIEQQRWDVAAHMLVYGLVKAQAHGPTAAANRKDSYHDQKTGRPARQPERP